MNIVHMALYAPGHTLKPWAQTPNAAACATLFADAHANRRKGKDYPTILRIAGLICLLICCVVFSSWALTFNNELSKYDAINQFREKFNHEVPNIDLDLLKVMANGGNALAQLKLGAISWEVSTFTATSCPGILKRLFRG
jgi:hypothetical protein